MQTKPFLKYIEKLALYFVFIASIHRVLLGGAIFLYPDTLRKVTVEVIAWVIVTGMFLWFIRRKGKLPEFVQLWRLNWPLILFLGIATLSLTWTVYFPLTLYKVIIMVATTTAAAYVGANMGLDDFLDKLAWFGAIVAVLSLTLAIALPGIGTQEGYPYYGAWDGIFWARGRLGSFMAFTNLVFLFQVSRSIRLPKLFVVNTIFYLLTLAIVYQTHSATSIILVLILHTAFLVALLWRKFRDRLTRPHYIAFGIFALILSVAALTNLGHLFGLLGRETSLTGRVPLWQYLLGEVFVQKPVLGYGFATIWEYDNFRYFMADIVGWPIPVLVGDNGFLDILLNLGIVGELSFLLVFIMTYVRVFKFSLTRGNILNFFPLLLMVYTLILNITLSHFFELEFFDWFLVASMLFLVTPKPQR